MQVEKRDFHGNHPHHVAIVMDGNRRWARARHLPVIEGHRRGVGAVRRTVEAAPSLGISTLTLFAFSSENWERSNSETSSLMKLLASHLHSEAEKLFESGVRFRAIGRIHELSTELQERIHALEQITRHNQRLTLNVAINYGGRQELIDVARALMVKAEAGLLQAEDLSETIFSEQLTTAGQSDPDLLIRTSGEQRVSNFLLWQLAYTELIFLPIYWPEFGGGHLEEAVKAYSHRERRFGSAV